MARVIFRNKDKHQKAVEEYLKTSPSILDAEQECPVCHGKLKRAFGRSVYKICNYCSLAYVELGEVI